MSATHGVHTPQMSSRKSCIVFRCIPTFACLAQPWQFRLQWWLQRTCKGPISEPLDRKDHFNLPCPCRATHSSHCFWSFAETGGQLDPPRRRNRPVCFAETSARMNPPRRRSAKTLHICISPDRQLQKSTDPGDLTPRAGETDRSVSPKRVIE